MKTKTALICLLATAFLGAAGASLYFAGKNAGQQVASPSATGSAHEKPLYWHDPMVPGQRFDKPGKSPYMDMPLMPVYAGKADDEGKVTISPQMQQNLGMRTGAVTRGRLQTVTSAIGSIAYNERDVALVQARSSGFVERLHVRAPLELVRKGQPLVDLFIPDWVAAQEEYLAARRMAGVGTDGLASAAKQRMLLAGMDSGQVQMVETSGKVQARMTVRAPVSGVVAELLVREGMTVSAGTPMFRINGVASVWVNAEVPEASAGLIRPGTTVEAHIPALGQRFMGKVSALLPEVSPVTRTLKARIALPNPEGKMVPGMFANLTFSTSSGSEVLLVPAEAVIKTGMRSVVMVAVGAGRFEPVNVETGAEGGDLVEIRKGLEEGQKVVLSGQFLLDSEASLRGAEPSRPQMPAGAPAAPVHHGAGIIEKVDKTKITISHGPITSLQWPAMTMGFKLPASGIPPGLSVGASVSFGFVQDSDGNFRLSEISSAPVRGGK